MEIYNENVTDLLTNRPLEIREDLVSLLNLDVLLLRVVSAPHELAIDWVFEVPSCQSTAPLWYFQFTTFCCLFWICLPKFQNSSTHMHSVHRDIPSVTMLSNILV